MIDCRYFEPTTVAEACTLLAEHGSGARVVAGGQRLSLLLRRGELKPSCLVSVKNAAGLDSITASKEGTKIGSMVTLQRLETARSEHPTLRALSETVADVADRQIRNRATLGGNICEAHPASDITVVLMALNAAVKLVSTDGERVVQLRDFVTDAFTTAAQSGELLTEVIIPPFTLPHSGAVYHRFALRAGDYPVVGVGAFVSVDSTGRCQEQRIVIGNCLGAPTHATNAEQQLQGCKVVESDQSLAAAASVAVVDITPFSEPMAPGEYKKDLVGVLTKSALTEAVALAWEERK